MTEPTPTPPPEAADGRHSAPQAPDGAEAHRDRDRGMEAGTGGTLREQIETAIAELTYYERDDASLITDAVMAVRDREMEQLRAKVTEIDHIINWHTTCASCARILDSAYAETVRAEKAEQRADHLAATLDEVLREFTHKGHPGVPCLRTPWINVKTVARWRAVLHPPQPAPAPDDGPSVQEAAAADRAHWTQKCDGE